MHERHRSPSQSPSRSPWRSSKCLKEKSLRVTERSIWTRAKHRVGLERPHLCTRFRGQGDAWGRSSPQRDCFRDFARVLRWIPEETGEEGKNYLLHFRNCHFFTRRSALLNSFSKTCNKRTRESHRAEKFKSGGSDPTFLADNPPKSFVGSLPPLLDFRSTRLAR